MLYRAKVEENLDCLTERSADFFAHLDPMLLRNRQARESAVAAGHLQDSADIERNRQQSEILAKMRFIDNSSAVAVGAC